jgi:hypothetical protein
VVVPPTNNRVNRDSAPRCAQPTDKSHLVSPAITLMAPKHFVAVRYYARKTLLSSTSRPARPAVLRHGGRFPISHTDSAVHVAAQGRHSSATGPLSHARALTHSWKWVYSEDTSDIDDAGRDERIGYDICGGFQNKRLRTPVCACTLAFVFFGGTVARRRTPNAVRTC